MAFFNELIDYIFMLFYPTNKRVGMKVRKAFTAGAQAALSQFFYEIRPIQYWSLCNPATKAFCGKIFFCPYKFVFSVKKSKQALH